MSSLDRRQPLTRSAELLGGGAGTGTATRDTP
jgi:hypothetical protein